VRNTETPNPSDGAWGEGDQKDEAERVISVDLHWSIECCYSGGRRRRKLMRMHFEIVARRLWNEHIRGKRGGRKKNWAVKMVVCALLRRRKCERGGERRAKVPLVFRASRVKSFVCEEMGFSFVFLPFRPGDSKTRNHLYSYKSSIDPRESFPAHALRENDFMTIS